MGEEKEKREEDQERNPEGLHMGEMHGGKGVTTADWTGRIETTNEDIMVHCVKEKTQSRFQPRGGYLCFEGVSCLRQTLTLHWIICLLW